MGVIWEHGGPLLSTLCPPAWLGQALGGPAATAGMPPRVAAEVRRSRITLQISQVYPIHDITGC